METRVLKVFFWMVSFATISQLAFAQSSNHVPNTAEEKRVSMLTPEYYTNWVGASFFTIPTVEKELDVVPVRILDLTFFYDFGDCFVGMQSNEKGVVTQMTVRLFADKAENFIQKAIDYGYKYVANGKDVNVRSNTGKILSEIYGTKVKRYQKSTKNGNVYMEVSTSNNYANEYEIAIFRAK